MKNHKMSDFNDKYYERFGGLRRSEIKLIEDNIQFIDYMHSFLFVPFSGDGLHYIHSLGKNVRGININQKNVEASPVKGLVVEGDARNLNFGDKEFECLFSIDLLEHLSIADLVTTLNEFFRVTSMTIFLAISTIDSAYFYNDPTHQIFWSRNTWKEFLSEIAKENSFKLIKFIEDQDIFILKYFDKC